MVDERSGEDLNGLLYRLRALPRGSVLFDPAEIEVVRTDDGTPSLGMPLTSGETFVVTPEPTQAGRYAILLTTDQGIKKLVGDVRGDELFAALMRRICPW